ncbi:MAG: hypothetical protein OHK0013_00540 [Sandaracinaceae bacterium]
MPIWKTQPTLRLYVEPPIRVGQSFDVVVEIEASEPVEVEWVDLTLQCVEGWAVGSGKNRVARSHRHPSLGARLVGPTVLSGTSRHRVRFEIPAGQPLSHEGGAAYARYSLHAQASIPWWPDARVSWPLAVRDRVRHAEPSPAVLGPNASQLLDIALDSQHIAVGGVVGGVVAVKRFWDGPPIVDVTLRELLELVSWNGYVRTRHGRRYTVSLNVGPELGGKAPFRFRFEDAPPTFDAITFRHRWELVFTPRHGGVLAVLAGIFGAHDVVVPVQVVESPTLAARSPMLVAPSIGDSRMQEILAEVGRARPGWRVEGLALERAVDGPFGATEARVEWVPRERATYLRAIVEPPTLGLGLRIGAAGLLDAFSEDVTVGHPSWDGARRVDARERTQASAFLSPLVAIAGDALVSGSDDHLELERVDATMSASSLAAFVDLVDRVVAAVPGALASIPPPRGTTCDRVTALEAARRVRGTFHPGDLALRGFLDERSLDARLLFEAGEVRALQIDVAPVPEGTLHLGPGRDAASLASLPEAARPIAGSLPEAVTVAIERGRARVWVMPTPGALFGVDHERVLALAERAVMLARSLSAEQGPFR